MEKPFCKVEEISIRTKKKKVHKLRGICYKAKEDEKGHLKIKVI